MRDHIVRSAGIIALGNVTSRVLGLVRAQIMAGLFGRTGGTDVFFVASNISQVFYDLLIQGAVSSALVPGFSVHAAHRERLSRLASLVLNLAVLVLSVVVLVIEAGAPLVIGIVAPGFSPALKDMAAGLTRITMLAVIFLGMSAVFTAVLNALQDFLFPAFCAALFNACIIVAAVLLHGRIGVSSLAVGMLIGSVAQVLLQLPPLVRRRLAYRFTFDFRDPELRRILLLYAPVAAGLVISGLQVFIDRNLASRTPEGSISAMQFATRLIQFPLGLIPTAIAGASLPLLSQRASDGALFRQTLGNGLRLIVFLILPAAAGLAVLARPIVAVIFQHGAFTAHDTDLTALALLLYLPGLPAAAIDQMLIFAFYARKNTLTPVSVGVLAIGLYLVVALLLIGPLGMAGLVIANSAQWLSHAIVLFVLLWRAMGGLGDLRLAKTVGQTIAATAGMGLAMWGVGSALAAGLPFSGLWTDLLTVTMAGTCGLLLFCGLAWLMKMDELAQLVGRFRRAER